MESAGAGNLTENVSCFNPDRATRSAPSAVAAKFASPRSTVLFFLAIRGSVPELHLAQQYQTEDESFQSRQRRLLKFQACLADPSLLPRSPQCDRLVCPSQWPPSD